MAQRIDLFPQQRRTLCPAAKPIYDQPPGLAVFNRPICRPWQLFPETAMASICRFLAELMEVADR